MASFQHLLVPIDDSAISAANVAQAIELARDWHARITFFHAVRTPAGAESGVLALAERLAGVDSPLAEGHALLAKAGAAASRRGVESSGSATASERPAEAIAAAARGLGCDLIVMASRGAARGGWTGWLHTSQTERVLRRAPVALLVTRVDAAQPLGLAERALGLLQDEHHSIAVVVKSMQAMADEAATYAPGGLDMDAFDRMLGYLVDFPEVVHHPKEERYLHAALRRRWPQAEALLARLEDEHREEALRVQRVGDALRALRSGGPEAAQHLARAVEALSAHVLPHMGAEEAMLFPLLRAHLLDEDWDAAMAAFELDRGPRYGELPAEEFRHLFVRIAAQAGAVERLAHASPSDLETTGSA